MDDLTPMTAIDFVFSVFPAAECFFASALLLWVFYAARQNHHKFLHFFFLLLGLFYLMSVFFYSKSYPIVAFSFVLSLPITLSVLPSYHLYLLSMTRSVPLSGNRRLLHFAPALITLFALLPFWLLPSEVQIAFVSGTLQNASDYSILQYIQPFYKISVRYLINAQFVLYLILMIKELRRYKKEIEERFSFKEQINLEWMVYSILFFTLLIFLISFSHFLGVSTFFYSRLVFNLLSVAIIFYLFVKGFTQRNVFMPRATAVTDEDIPTWLQSKPIAISTAPIPLIPVADIDPIAQKSTTETKAKYFNSGLNDDKKEKLLDELKKLIFEKKIFLNNKLDIDQLAEMLQTNSTWLSQVINETYKKNFFNFINEIRIEEAKMMLRDESNNKYTLEAMAWSCGFNSRSSFHSAFRKFTGMTPTEYRKNNKA